MPAPCPWQTTAPLGQLYIWGYRLESGRFTFPSRMVNFHDPAKIARDFLSLVKLWHTVDGLFIWEFFTTLDYEWSFIQRRRPYLWTIWIYSLTRVSTLLAVAVSMIGFDVTTPINCQAWVTSEVVFAYIAIASSSLLIALRTVAIWNRNKIILVISMGAWLTNVGFLIHSVVKLRSSWTPALGACAVVNTESSKYNVVATLSTDAIMLLIMLVRLFYIRLTGGMLGLGRFLWTQGNIWFLLATVAQVPPAVFIYLNLNDPYNLMFQTPALITMSIASTRMYRLLTNFGAPDNSKDDPPSRIVAASKPISLDHVSFNRMEVAVHTNPGQYPASQTSQDSLYIGKDGQPCDKPRGLCGDDGANNGGER